MLSTEGGCLAQVGTSGNGVHSAVLPPWVMLNLFGISAAVLDVLPVCPDSICSGVLRDELTSYCSSLGQSINTTDIGYDITNVLNNI
jgi:hypothetical protein